MSDKAERPGPGVAKVSLEREAEVLLGPGRLESNGGIPSALSYADLITASLTSLHGSSGFDHDDHVEALIIGAADEAERLAVVLEADTAHDMGESVARALTALESRLRNGLELLYRVRDARERGAA